MRAFPLSSRTEFSIRPDTAESNKWRDFDPMLLAAVLVMIGFGVVSIWSAVGLPAIVSDNLGTRQAAYSIAGLVLMLVLAAIDYRFIQTGALLLYVIGLLSLAAVLSPLGYAPDGTNAQNWINLGITTIQPSEFAKVTTLIALAAFVSSRGEQMKEFGSFFIAGLIVAVPAGMILLGPDLGQTMVYVAMWASTLIVMNTRKLFIALIALVTPAAGVFAYFNVLQDYQRDRILLSYNPENDSLGGGFQIIQARISIGAGGWTGEGLAGGSQSRADILSVRESDFIFAHASSMFGFIGMLALFLGIVMVLWRCLSVVEISRDSFGQVMAVGVSGIIFFQAFLNIGMNVGLMPVAGITLPFVSAGISSLWTFLAFMGILQSVRMHHRRLDFMRG